jgi:hypothetical protein
MINHLHDEIDALEEITGESRELTVRIVQQRFAEHLNGDDEDGSIESIVEAFRAAMFATAVDVADAHAPITTRAVKLGDEHARKRYERSK